MVNWVNESVGQPPALRTSISLHWRLRLFLGSVFLITLVLIGTSVYYFVSIYEQRTWQQRQQEATGYAAETINKYVFAAKDTLTLLELLGIDELQRDTQTIHGVLRANPALQEIAYFDQDQRVIAQAARDRAVLTLASTEQMRWFQTTEAREPFLSGRQHFADLKPYVIMALPTATRGLLVARIDIGLLTHVVDELRFGTHGRVYLLNQGGDLLALAQAEQPGGTANAPDPAELTLQLARAQQPWQSIYTNPLGMKVSAIALPVAGTDWVLINELALSDARAVSRAAFFWLAWGMALFAVLVMVAVNYFLRSSIIRPLASLRTIAERIGHGDLSQRIEIHRLDEVGAVATTFNHMVDRLLDREETLRRTYDELELRVQERTVALRDSVARIQLIADNVPALIAYVDADEYYRFVNKRFEEWYIKTELVDRHLRDVAGEGGYENIARYVQAALAGKETTFAYSRRYPDGQLRHVEINYIPHFSPERRVMGFFTLVQDLTAHKNAEEQIKASLDEKVVLLKEIHHRVKNNLQVISSLLYLQREKITDAQLREILQDSQNRVKSMALIHEKLYQAKDLARVNLSEYIRNLVSYLLRAHNSQANQVRLHVDADQIALGIDTAMPCGLIINELVSNALKHAFPNGRDGEIHITLQTTQASHFCLTVCDNGIGFPGDIDFQNTLSLGLQLVNTLVQQLDGSIKLLHERGTKFEIQFSELP